MVLSREELLRYASNSINYKEQDGYITLLRFTDRQLDVYKDSPMFKTMSLCSSGICLLFDTTGDEITFECKSESLIKAIKPSEGTEPDEEILPKMNPLKVLGLYAKYMLEAGVVPDIKQYFDLYADGNYIKSVKLKNGKISFRFPNRNRQWVNIRIWFPLFAQVSISDVTCNGRHRAPSKKASKVFYSFGDSITQGFMVGKPSFGYVQALSQLLDANMLNQGISSYSYSPQILTDFENLPVPDGITVAYGTNDWGLGHSYDEIEENVRGFYARLKELFPQVPIYVITPIWRKDMDSRMESGSLQDVIALVKRIARKYKNVRIIDGMSVSPHCPKLYQDGFLHPGIDGNAYMVPRIYQAILNGERK